MAGFQPVVPGLSPGMEVALFADLFGVLSNYLSFAVWLRPTSFVSFVNHDATCGALKGISG